MREKVAIDILIFYLKMMYDAEKTSEGKNVDDSSGDGKSFGTKEDRLILAGSEKSF